MNIPRAVAVLVDALLDALVDALVDDESKDLFVPLLPHCVGMCYR